MYDSPRWQPPSGGCVLKRRGAPPRRPAALAAAFGRLCVETRHGRRIIKRRPQPPSGGCVLKQISFAINTP